VQKTDQPPLKIAHEVIREKIFRRLNSEIPYEVYQENEGWTELTNGALRIDQVLIVKKKSQQAILVGTKGENVQGISLEASRDLSTIFNRKVWLRLRVVVRTQLPEDATISEPLIA
jgi:GTPase